MAEVCVRVALRVRPLLPREVVQGHQVCVRVVPDSPQVMLGADRSFLFDHALGPSSRQSDVYESCVKPLLGPLMDGFNATVFAYGQTGSGKTYTLGGGHVAAVPEEEAGIVSRVAQDLFSSLGEKSEVDASVRVSYVELYREELRDLLELHTVHKELHIREDERGNTVVVGAIETEVTSAAELLSVLEAGNALRHTGSTHMNERSSRSHAVLTLLLTQRRRDDSLSSKLRLVDLAGSERAAGSRSSAQRLKESVYINTGLLALGNVIRALAVPSAGRRSNHVPYRDAKITRLLRDSLGGSAHTLMVACVSPSHRSVAETLSVLQFASRARHVRNCPGARGACPGWDPGEARVGELEQEVQTLRQALRTRTRQEEDQPDRKSRRTEGEESQFRCLAKDAAFLLEELQSSAHNNEVVQLLQDWLERHRELSQSEQPAGEAADRREGQHMTILQLRRELRKCQETLAVDQLLLEQREGEVQILLHERHTQLKALEEERELRRIQSDQLVEQQLLINCLRGNREDSGSSVPRRPHSVPLLSQGHRHTRKIHTSPPACSLERVLAAFKTRSALLLAQIEEQDKVLTPPLLEEQRGEEEEEGGKRFRRSMNRTWTSKQREAQSPGSHHSHQLTLSPACREGPGGGAPGGLSQTGHAPQTVKENGVSDDALEKHLQEKRAWLEQEEELALQRRRGLQELEEELWRREEVLLHREACLLEKNQLEMKRLRSSQALSQDLLRVSARLVEVEEELKGGAGAGAGGGASLEELCRERAMLRKRREEFTSQLREARLLSPQEEHALLQLEEALEALDAAVEFKDRSIQEKHTQLGGPAHTQPGSPAHTAPADPAHHDVIRKLRELSQSEASALLVKYFNKVVGLRERERGLQLSCDELRLAVEEQRAAVAELEAALQRLTLDTEHRLTLQHTQHQHSIQLLLQQQEPGCRAPVQMDPSVQAMLQKLERDLFFYKSTSRELKKKLKELVNPSLQPQPQPQHQAQPQAQPQPQHQPQAQPSSKPLTQGRGEGQGGGGEDVSGVVKLTPVRLSRRELRQIFPGNPVTSTPRQVTTSLTTSCSSIQQDSIEVSRTTHD